MAAVREGSRARRPITSIAHRSEWIPSVTIP
jgi:hypothetical protein